MTPGSAAPDFTLLDQSHQLRHLYGQLEQSQVMLIFYPYDQSPNCTRQLCAINVELAKNTRHNVAVWGINNANAESHQRFADKEFLNMPLLSDDGYHVSRRFGCLFSIGPIRVIRRTVVVIGQDGRIRLYQRGHLSLSEALDRLVV